eukprot:15835540-Heterocapsa_arctica.AAC.1
MCARKPPRWAARMLRLLPPGWMASVGQPDSSIVGYMRAICRGCPPAGQCCAGPAQPFAVVYILGCHAG